MLEGNSTNQQGMFDEPTLLDRGSRNLSIRQIRSHPLLAFFHRHSLPLDINGQLIAFDLADVEVTGGFVEEMQTTDG